MVEVAGAASGSPMLSVELRQLGGALARSDPDAGALSALDGEFALFTVGIAADEQMKAATSAHADKVMSAFAPWDAGRAFLNFCEQETDCATLFREDAYRRLREVKSAYDPGNVFRANHEVEPAT
jgi:hypothetical protein